MTDYGTVEYYTEMFSDILADCSCGNNARDEQTIRNVMIAFEKAIISWMDYHDNATKKYRELHRRFMTGDLD